MTIEELKEQKKENVKRGLLNFLEEYQLSQDNPNSFDRHSNNCGNQARTIGEAFSKYIILNSDIDDDTEKRNTLNKTLGDIGRRIIRKDNRYIENDRDWNRIKLSIERILDIGNNASHDNENQTSKLDLEAIKNALLYLGEYLFGQEFIDNLTSNSLNNSSASTLDSSLEEIEKALLSNSKNKYHYSLLAFLLLIVIGSVIIYLIKNSNSQEIVMNGNGNNVTQKNEQSINNQKAVISGSDNTLIQENVEGDKIIDKKIKMGNVEGIGIVEEGATVNQTVIYKESNIETKNFTLTMVRYFKKPLLNIEFFDNKECNESKYNVDYMGLGKYQLMEIKIEKGKNKNIYIKNELIDDCRQLSLNTSKHEMTFRCDTNNKKREGIYSNSNPTCEILN